MDPFKNVLFSQEIQANLKEIVDVIKNVDAQVEQSCLLSNVSGIFLVTKIQALFNVTWNNSAQKVLFDMILDHCHKAERRGPGSFLPTLRLITSLLEGKTFDKEQALQEIVKNSFRPTQKQFYDLVENELQDERFLNLFREIIQTAGLEGKVIFEKSQNENLIVEAINGFNFNVEFGFPMNDVRRKDVKVLVIDGRVESVGEVHNLLQESSSRKESLLLITRGLHPDVTNTLKVNFSRGTLNVIPVDVKYDFEGINYINDMAIVSGTDVVSSMKGQLISSIKYDEIASVPFVVCHGNVLTIVNNKTMHNAQIQVKKLVEKRYEAQVDELAKSFDTRIKSLTPNCVKVKVPQDRFFATYSEKFDVSMRLLKSIVRRGMMKNAGNCETLSCLGKIVPLDTALATVQFAFSCVDVLSKTNVVMALS